MKLSLVVLVLDHLGMERVVSSSLKDQQPFEV